VHLLRMGIFDRMGKVISSNVNALLDKAEDPKKSLDLVVEEMKDHIKAAKKELVEGVAAEKVLRKKVEELDADVTKWERRAELAFGRVAEHVQLRRDGVAAALPCERVGETARVDRAHRDQQLADGAVHAGKSVSAQPFEISCASWLARLPCPELLTI